MDKLIKEMYDDAMIVEDLQEVVSEAALCNGKLMMLAWNRAKDRLGDMISRMASIDLEYSKKLLNCWKVSGEGQTDFRKLSYNIEKHLLPAVREALQRIYHKIEVKAGKWTLEKSDVGFLTAKFSESGRYIHSSFDPMREASIFADRLYCNGMIEFHILGSGLGYLAYQIWEKSKRSVKIYVYEEDKVLLESAFNIGVLGWIDEEDLCVIDSMEIDDMLMRFIKIEPGQEKGKYVSDYKAGAYGYSQYGEIIDNIDFNMRTERIFSIQWEANRIRNSRMDLKSVSNLKKDMVCYDKDFAVVSAGPSLNDNIDFLKTCSDKLVIICINAAIKRLFAEEIYPNITAMLDPFLSLEAHIEGVEDFTKGIPLVMPLTGSSSFSKRYKGPIYIVPENGETDGFYWNYGGTVASLGLDLAFYMGAKRIFLIGSDLAYAGGKNYADGLAHDKDEGATGVQADVYVKAVDGGMVRTNPLYNVFRSIMETQIAIHSDVEVINLSSSGALIAGTIHN